MVRKLLIFNALAIGILLSFAGCSIEPPLKLADAVAVDVNMPEVVTEFDIIWDIDYDWRAEWWYGWDETDEAMFGPLEYDDPTYFETRIYYLGDSPDGTFKNLEANTVFGNGFTRRFSFGYYDMLIWSNISSPDGTQVLRIDESDLSDIFATTSTTSLSYRAPSGSRGPFYNNPEIFFAGRVNDFYVSSNPADYDEYDPVRQVYVKHLNAKLYPMVYTYLVQVVIYNNKGRITGTADRSGITSMADGVSLHTGHTSMRDVTVIYDMRMKQGVAAREGAPADILGGKLNTFGLCDIDPRSRSSESRYSGSRGNLTNHVMLNLKFANAADSVYYYDVTSQLQRQIHGGLVTIEIDADTLAIPNPGSHTGGGGIFDPTVELPDSVEYVIPM